MPIENTEIALPLQDTTDTINKYNLIFTRYRATHTDVQLLLLSNAKHCLFSSM